MFIAIFSASVLGYCVGFFTYKFIAKKDTQNPIITIHEVCTGWVLQSEHPLPEKLDGKVVIWDGEDVDYLSPWSNAIYNMHGQRTYGFANKPIIAWMKIPKGPLA